VCNKAFSKKTSLIKHLHFHGGDCP
jgi:hypothetical protein